MLSFGIAEVEEIDRNKHFHAGLLAMHSAVEGLTCIPIRPGGRATDSAVPLAATRHHRGDSLSASIAAASIIAKTTRDALMLEFDSCMRAMVSPRLQVTTPEHCRALKELGALPFTGEALDDSQAGSGTDPIQSELFEEQPEPMAMEAVAGEGGTVGHEVSTIAQ